MDKKTQEPQPLPREFLIKRGFCCGNGCFHCPYITADGEKHVKGTNRVSNEQVASSDERYCSSK